MNLTLIRGLPGSGKSTLAKMLYDESRYGRFTMWCEADHWFITESGEYKFNASFLHDAHKWCQEQTEIALSKDGDVIVSNTFTTMKELKPYMILAGKYSATFQIIECHGDFGSIHNVPEEVLDRMRDRWQNTDMDRLEGYYKQGELE